MKKSMQQYHTVRTSIHNRRPALVVSSGQCVLVFVLLLLLTVRNISHVDRFVAARLNMESLSITMQRVTQVSAEARTHARMHTEING